MSSIAKLDTRLVPVALPPGIGHLTYMDTVLVRIETDDGIVGHSYVWLPSSRQTAALPATATIHVVELAVHALSGFLIGEDIFSYEWIWSAITHHQEQAGDGVLTQAHSALDMAMWDAMGKSLGTPLYKLLGAHKSEVPYYTNELIKGWGCPPEAVAEHARRLVDAGCRALKMPLAARPGEPMSLDVGRVKAVRAAVGPDVKMMVDVGGRVTVDTAIRLARELEDVGLAWFEDPVPLHDVDGLCRVRRSIDIPIATGDTCWRPRAYRYLFERQALDIALFEPMRIGGVTGAIKLAALAQQFDIPVAPHVYPELGVQLMAGFPNGMIVEYLPWWANILQRPLTVTGATLIPPDEPGIGLTPRDF